MLEAKMQDAKIYLQFNSDISEYEEYNLIYTNI